MCTSMDRYIDTSMDGYIDRSMDGYIDGWIDRDKREKYRNRLQNSKIIRIQK